MSGKWTHPAPLHACEAPSAEDMQRERALLGSKWTCDECGSHWVVIGYLRPDIRPAPEGQYVRYTHDSCLVRHL